MARNVRQPGGQRRREARGRGVDDRAGCAASTALPLSGIRVLTFENFGAGPFGSMYLADLGAEVIKIENREQAAMPRAAWGRSSWASRTATSSRRST